MILEIENIGKIDINKLPSEYPDEQSDNSLEDLFCITTSDKNIKCLVCNSDFAIPLAEKLMSNDGLISEALWLFSYSDIGDYWYYVTSWMNETDINQLIVIDAFDKYIEHGIIKKVFSDDIKKLSPTSPDFVYIFPNYDDFDLKRYPELIKDLANEAIEILDIFETQNYEVLKENLKDDYYYEYYNLYRDIDNLEEDDDYDESEVDFDEIEIYKQNINEIKDLRISLEKKIKKNIDILLNKK